MQEAEVISRGNPPSSDGDICADQTNLNHEAEQSLYDEVAATEERAGLGDQVLHLLTPWVMSNTRGLRIQGPSGSK